jgi:1,4-alpha-glucan branching enzyme
MVTQLADGRHLFRVFLPHAACVQVVGTFTSWRERPLEMERHHPGWWSVTADIAPGQHEFCYLVDHAIWLADYAAHGVRLSSGGQWVSRLVAADAGVVRTDARVAV